MDSAIKKKALLTGATGFVGANLTRRMIALGWEVHILVRAETDLGPLGDALSCLGIHFHDGTTEGLSGIMGETKPYFVFHLASLFKAQHRAADVEALIRSNILLGTQLLEAMQANGAYRFVHAGTSWQHFEDRPYSPVCLYAATKQAFEDIVQYYTEATPLKAIALKLFDTYGPGDRRPKLLPALIELSKRGAELPMSPGEQAVDLVHVEDAVNAFLIAAERLEDGRTERYEKYAVSSQKPVRLRELVDRIGQLQGMELDVRWGGLPYRPREVMVPWTTGKRLPGWEPRVKLEDGLKEIFSPREGREDNVEAHGLIKPFPGNSHKRYLVVCRAGDRSLHRQWIHPSSSKNFDLFVEYYGDRHRVYEHDCEIYSEAKGIKWGRFYKLIRQYGEMFFRYDAVWFPDDDIAADSRTINELFSIFSRNNLVLASGALSHDSYLSWMIEKQEPEFILRYTNFIHIMAPIFSREALMACWQTFGGSQIGLGLDFLWPKVLGFPKDRIAIIDAAPVKHSRPNGGGTIIADCGNQKIDPMAEFEKLKVDYKLELYHPAVFGGILKEGEKQIWYPEGKIY